MVKNGVAGWACTFTTPSGHQWRGFKPRSGGGADKSFFEGTHGTGRTGCSAGGARLLCNLSWVVGAPAADNREKIMACRSNQKKEGTTMAELKVVYLPPGDLTPYEGNARTHAPQDIEAIKKSILEDGFNDPIGVWGDRNIIVEGHGRQIAALELGLERVPVIRLDHLTDKQRREYTIRHNRTAELSGWDFGKLEEECSRLSIEGQDFPELKFSFEDFEPPVPEDLDNDSVGVDKIGAKFTFDSYTEYRNHEEELKNLAEEMGAVFSVVKS